MKLNIEGTCCQFCRYFEQPECPVNSGLPWPRWLVKDENGDWWCNKFVPSSLYPSATAAKIGFSRLYGAQKENPHLPPGYADAVKELPDNLPAPSIWEDAPEWANWLAKDENGDWWWYEDKPLHDDGYWYRISGRCDTADTVNWKDSLEQRPKEG